MRSFVSTVLVRITWALTIAALLAFSISAGLFDLSRPAQAATAALSSPAGQRLATDFIADQLLVAVPGLSEKRAQDLATKVAADPGTLVALKQANLTSVSAPQDRAALLEVVASQLKETNPKVAAATEEYAGQVRAAAASDQADPDSALSELPSPVGGILKRVQQFTDGATNVSAVMSDLKARLAHTARVLAGLAILTALGALVIAPSRPRVVRSFGWMFISISLIPAAIGWLVPDLVLARMSSDWAQALAVGLRVGGSRLIGLFAALLCAGVVLLILGLLGSRIGSLLTPTRAPGERQPRPGAPYPPAGRSPEAARPPRAGQPYPEEPAVTRPMETTHYDDRGYATPPSGYPYPQSYPQPQQPPAFPGDQYPDSRPYGEQPTAPLPYGPPGDGSDRRR
jgi:hypothetical protein